jgi:hypothetical protein
MEDNWLVCGTRRGDYKDFCITKLDEFYHNRKALKQKGSDWKPRIIEGCCPDSADAYAEEWATGKGFEIMHHPSTQGNYLKRNIEMCKKATLVFAFWDGYSYGTAHNRPSNNAKDTSDDLSIKRGAKRN